MNEADVRRKLFRTARALGYIPITQTDLYTPIPSGAVGLARALVGRTSGEVRGMAAALAGMLSGAVAKPPTGRPDTLWLNVSGPTKVCEVKVVRPAETGFSFSKIDDKQRKWLNWWRGMGGAGYLGIGHIVKGGSRDALKSLWLVPWEYWAWLETEWELDGLQRSIPATARKGMRVYIQENGLDLETILSPFLLTREGGEFLPQKGHPEWVNYKRLVHRMRTNALNRRLIEQLRRRAGAPLTICRR
jgi:hypothetical protein